MDMLVANTIFKKRNSHLVAYESGIAMTQVDYILVKKKDRRYLQDVKVIPGEKFVTQHKPVICDFRIKKVYKVKRKYTPRRKVWRPDDAQVKQDFEDQVSEIVGASSNGRRSRIHF